MLIDIVGNLTDDRSDLGNPKNGNGCSCKPRWFMAGIKIDDYCVYVATNKAVK